MTWLDENREILAPLGLSVDTWSPGDGQTRYRFLPAGKEYFSDRGIGTYLGKKTAEAFLAGLVQGAEAQKDVRAKDDSLFINSLAVQLYWNLYHESYLKPEKEELKGRILELLGVFFPGFDREGFLSRINGEGER